jgi:hypothetical protein
LYLNSVCYTSLKFCRHSFRNIYKIIFKSFNDFCWFVSAIVVGCYVAAVFALLLGGVVWYK